MPSAFRCSQCFGLHPRHLRGMCKKCYLKAYPAVICHRCKKRNATASSAHCGRCQKNLCTKNYRRPTGDTTTAYSTRGGVPVSNLLLSAREEEEERSRRAEIYARHIEEHGHILWGQCAPKHQATPASHPLSLLCSVSDSDTDLQED